MKFVSAADMREGEGRAIRQRPVLDREMMDRAGRGLARVVADIARRLDRSNTTVRLLAGPGNNGGDIFAAALHLLDMGLEPEVWLTCPPAQLKGAARTTFEQMLNHEIFCLEMTTTANWDLAANEVQPPEILVDGLLGTGVRGAPKGVLRAAIDYLNRQSRTSLVVSADIPSGMNADTGAAAGAVVQADFTVTMGFPKVGMATPVAAENLGALIAVPIGLPAEYADAIPDAMPGLQWISAEDVRRILPRRRRDSHKGSFGRTLLLGGSAQYPGAIALAAEGAVRSGAGLVQVAASPAAMAAILARTPEVIAGNMLDPDVALDGANALLAGPGLGRDPETRRLVARLLRETPGPLVLDADAIAVLDGKPEVVQNCSRPVILTPHPGELAQLLGIETARVQQERLAAVREAAERTGAIVIIKGAGTLVAQTGQPTWLNLTGNPGMACGGSGDVLAGLLAGLLAQKIPPNEAACAAVWLHGTAGDIAALKKTQAAMSAGDIAGALPEAFQEIAPR